MARVYFRVEGMRELERSLKRLGKVPQKHVTSSARKAMNSPLKKARANAPYLTGNLQRGMKLKGEKSKYKAKKVYQIVFDEKMNHIFQKPVKKPGESGNPKARKIAYYPFSQEYGFFARDGRYIPGFRFISDSFVEEVPKIEITIIKTMKKKIDAEIAKAGLK